MSAEMLHHATAVIWRGNGLLLVGESGSGKSTLAAAFIAHGGSLIADDQVWLRVEGGKLHAAPPVELAGVLELAGLGLMRLSHEQHAPLHLAVRCQTQPAERLPLPETLTLLGISLPQVTLNPAAAYSAERLMLWAEAVQEGRVLPEDWRPVRP